MSNNKRTLYVGGLADEIDINILKSAFSAFGDVVDVNLPIDYTTQKHKGFAFVEFQLPEDALDAIDNMDNAEILGRTIRVNIAKPMRFKESNTRPIWADDEYLRTHGRDGEQEITTQEVTGETKGSDGDDDEESD